MLKSHIMQAYTRALAPLGFLGAFLLLTGCGINNIPTYDEAAGAA